MVLYKMIPKQIYKMGRATCRHQKTGLEEKMQTILVVEDDHDLNQSIGYSLKKSGYGVLGAAFMEKGLHQSGRHRFLQDFTVNRRCMTSLVLELPSFLPAGNLQNGSCCFAYRGILAIVLLITHQNKKSRRGKFAHKTFQGTVHKR